MNSIAATGARYPAATNAWRGGIQPWSAVASQLPPAQPTYDDTYTIDCRALRDHSSPADEPSLTRHVACRVIPQCIRSPDGWRVRHYLVLNLEANSIDYAVSPDSLDEFLRDAAGHSAAAAPCRGRPAPARRTSRV